MHIWVFSERVRVGTGAAARHGFTDVDAAEQWVVDNWPVLKIQLGNRIPPTVEQGVADVSSACEVSHQQHCTGNVRLTFCVYL